MKNQFALILILAAILITGCAQKENVAAIERESMIPSNASKVTPEADLYPPKLHSDGWKKPVPLSSAINTAGAEDSPFVTPDGSILYFFFTPDVRVPPEKQLLDQVTGIYVSKKVNGSWSKAARVVLQDQGKLALDGCWFAQDSSAWFCSAREGYTGVNLFTAEYREGKWTGWQYAGDKLNREYKAGEMHITADGKELYFHSDRAGGKGQLDIWVTGKVGGDWQQPENVRAVNTPENEGWPYISQDGKEMWFTRTYSGTPAIFRSRNVNGEWQEPELIISQFAGEPSLDNAGNIYFVHHYFRDGKMIEADIYVAERK